MFALATAAFADDLDFTALRFLAVQKDGRKKPLDTVALETVEKLTGKKSFTDPESGRSMAPMDVLLSMWLETRDWSKVPVILVNYAPLRDQLGLPADQKYFTYSQLATPKFQELISRIEQKESGKQKADLTHDEREASVVEQRLRTLSEAVGPESLAVVPHPREVKGAWVPVTKVAKYYNADKEAELQKMFKSLAAAYIQRDPGTFAVTSGKLRSLLVSLSPSVYPDFASLQREVHYNSFHPFRKAMVLYAIAFVVVVM